MKTALWPARCPKCHGSTHIEYTELTEVYRPVLGATDDGVIVVDNGNQPEIGDDAIRAFYRCKECLHEWPAQSGLIDFAEQSEVFMYEEGRDGGEDLDPQDGVTELPPIPEPQITTWDASTAEGPQRMAAMVANDGVYFVDYDQEAFGWIPASLQPLPSLLRSFVMVAYTTKQYLPRLARPPMSTLLMDAIRRDFGRKPTTPVEGDVPGDASLSAGELLDDEQSGAYFNRYIAGDR